MSELQDFVGDYYRSFIDTLQRFDKSSLDGIQETLLGVAAKALYGSLETAGAPRSPITPSAT